MARAERLTARARRRNSYGDMFAHPPRGGGLAPVLLFHGFLGSGRNVASLARRWAELDPGVTVFAADLPGHGRSSPLPPGADLGAMGEAIWALADRLGLAGPVHLAGHSMGGRAAMAARLLDPARVSRLTLLDIAPGPLDFLPASDALEALHAAPAEAADRAVFRDFLLARGLSPAMVEWLAMNLEQRGDRWVWRVDREALARFHRRTAGTDLWPAIGGPVRVLRGALSPYVRDVDAARYAASGAEVETIPDAGHFLHVDAPEVVARRVAAPQRQR
jgi:esterase